MANNLMTIIAEHGTGDDILALAAIMRAAGNKNVPYQPVSVLKHMENTNIYTCLGFNPNDVFRAMNNLQVPNDSCMTTEFMECMLGNQLLTERMAMLGFLLMKSMPPEMVGYHLGGKP